MPSIINLGAMNVNTPQQNSSIFLGESVVTGMDANMKFNVGRSGEYGFFRTVIGNANINIDSYEVADGNMVDNDIKTNSFGGNI